MPTMVEDKDAIREVMAEYCYHLDERRFVEMAGLFTENGTWETAFGTATGRANIAALAASLGKPGEALTRRVHYVTNIVIKLDGDRASVRSNWVQVDNSAPNSGLGPKIGSGGGYADAMVRQGDRWFFQHRKIDRFLV